MFGGIPFEHFAQAGGGRMPRGRGGPSPKADTTKLYETLGVKKDATAKQIRKAYLMLSKEHHPDKGGDDVKFKEISAAYEVLKDEEKKKVYDKYGLEGLKEGGGGDGGDGMDIFEGLFGGGGRRRRSGPEKGPPTNHPLKVSLADIFKGKTVKLAVQRDVIVGDVEDCSACGGRGQVMEMRQIGPGMIQQIQRTCEVCGGLGKIAKTKKEREVLEVHVEKGMRDGQKISFKGKGNEKAGMEAGDINFIVQIKPHAMFKRKGADLLMTKEVSLRQALCGLAFQITHLDDRDIIIKTESGEIIKPEESHQDKMAPYVKRIPGEGLPSLGNPFVRGDLYILFRVRFPSFGELSDEQIKALKAILPTSGDENVDIEDYDETVEVHTLECADLQHFGKGGAAATDSRAYDSDDEEEGAQSVQCQQS